MEGRPLGGRSRSRGDERVCNQPSLFIFQGSRPCFNRSTTLCSVTQLTPIFIKVFSNSDGVLPNEQEGQGSIIRFILFINPSLISRCTAYLKHNSLSFKVYASGLICQRRPCYCQDFRFFTVHYHQSLQVPSFHRPMQF